MAEIIVAELVKVVLGKLASEPLKKIIRSQGIYSELKNLGERLSHIQALLNDASHKEIADESVKRWLNRLQHLAYDIDDILDDLSTEAMHREFTQQSAAITTKVRKLIPTCCTNFSLTTRLQGKLDYITTKLHDLETEKGTLGLIVKMERSKNLNRKLQTSMVDSSRILGREAEKEALVHKLLGDEPCDENFSVVPIVGMGGVGKTTLARLLYDDKQVKDHFELKAWVCVSDEFDSFGISKVIFQSVTGEKKEFEDLNLLQVALKDHLREKRFLLVLDDVWSESYADWETLVGPFHACAPGSKIIITTRKEQLLKLLGYYHLNRLQSLSHEDALSLVAQHALGAYNFDSHMSLKPYGEGIVKKCDGLPLALVALGRLLRTKKDEEEYWKEVLDSEIWKLHQGGGIVPALRLSYHDLSACLKQLFAYCSLFPKDFLFEKEELVLLWMAEGFLNQSTPSNSTEERLGHEYFDELLSRSFFQHDPNDKSLFVMHDLLNDLATYVAGEFFLRQDSEIEKDMRNEVLEKYRHMSFVREEYETYKKFEAIKRAKSLRTFLATSAGVVESWQEFYFSYKILVDLLPRLPLLRVLSLSNYHITEVPESISNLKHLRYLNLSETKIKHLPESVCNLYNLQTLIVFGCDRLTKLPDNFSNLKNLRHLDIRGTELLNKMPRGIGELKSLQTLSKIVIEGENGFEIGMLEHLKNLCGKISIERLDKVHNAVHARKARFSQKRLSELEVGWCDLFDDSRKEWLEKEVLNELKPCNNDLKQLKIRSYGGLEFPKWVGDPSFLRLKHVSISRCRNCTYLPPLGQLPSLKELFIECMDKVKCVGSELLGTGLAFPSLEIISLKNMIGLKVWSIHSNNRVVFPCLKKLHIKCCNNLVEVSLGVLPSLKVLKLKSCGHGVLRSLLNVAPSVTKLEINDIFRLTDDVWRRVLENLRALEELVIRWCREIRYLWESEEKVSTILVNLRKLRVKSCDNLVRLGEKEEDNDGRNLLTSLKVLQVKFCKNMELCKCPHSIETLDISYCTSITSIYFPRGRRLKSLNISNCIMKSWVLMNSKIMPILEDAYILHLPNLKSVDLSYFNHLSRLTIRDCENLESLPDLEFHKLTSLQYMCIISCPIMDASFPRAFWPPKLCSLEIGRLKKPMSEWGLQNFPTSLVSLDLWGDDGVSSCGQLSHLLPSSLVTLRIKRFRKLESMELQHLTSLRHLSFYNCPNMMCLPETLLPSLLSLSISSCPNLKERCNTSRRDSFWPFISHIPKICISPDNE